MNTKVLIADDHALVRQGIRSLLGDASDLEIVGEATDGRETVMLCEQLRPDIAIIDISMRELHGIEAIAQVRRKSPTTVIIALSMFGEERYVTRAVRAGAKAYVLKDSSGEDLLQAIRAVQQGQSFFSPSVAKVMLEAYSRGLDGVIVEDKYELLTDREREIYQMLAEGKTNKVIADQLGLKMHTVETHRLRVMNKLDVHNMAQLVLSAVRRGVVA
ncbi:MAG: response regulator transcription factor [Bryobacteraceae bacterium]